MTTNNINSSTNEIRKIVQEWADKSGQDRCWWFPELFQRLADILKITPNAVPFPPRNEFEEGCCRYQDEHYGIRPRVSTITRLFDDESTRKKFEVMNKGDVMLDDARNDNMDFWVTLDDFLKWGKTYRITFEQLD